MIVLLPLIPAFFLYRLLPSDTLASKAEGALDSIGPFRELRINFSGASAAYLVVAIILVFMISKYNLQPPSMRQQSEVVWTLGGQLGFEGVNDLQYRKEIDAIKVAVQPKTVDIGEYGDFNIRILAKKRKEDTFVFPKVFKLNATLISER